MPAKPTLVDYFDWRFVHTSNHWVQSANRHGEEQHVEEIILACLLTDTVQELIKRSDLAVRWEGAQMYEPYGSPKVACT